MNPFKGLGQLTGLLSQLPKLREEMDKLQQRLPQLVAEGQAGAGMVTVRVNGKFEVLACRLSEEAVELGDREMLEDLIRSATNQALDKARQLVAEETGKMAGAMGLPPGLSLPGFPES